LSRLEQSEPRVEHAGDKALHENVIAQQFLAAEENRLFVGYRLRNIPISSNLHPRREKMNERKSHEGRSLYVVRQSLEEKIGG
jgi:hypothetical protein